MIARRPLLAGLATFVGGAAIGAAPASGRVAFELTRKGSRIGTHVFDFARDGEDLAVGVAIDIRVTVALIPVYRYSHRNRERWRGNRLVAIDTETNDDGDRFFVRGAPGDGGLRVEATSGNHLLPADIVPTSYWNTRTIGATQLLNTQDGSLARIAVAPRGAERIETAQGPVEATAYDMSGDLKLQFWYDAAEVLARIRFQAKSDGSVIDYRRI